jgi:inner membrane protein
MDSVSQIALGAAVSVAVMGRHTPLGRAALWGAVCGTLPDLDALIDHGDAVRNMVLHRAATHAPFFLLLIAPLIAALIAVIHGDVRNYRRWWLAVALVLVTHPLLDVMTIYGTQLGLPLTNHPYGVGSIFIIDPLYTLPLIAGVVAALRLGDERGQRWNLLGIGLSCGYLVWGVAIQHQVRDTAEQQLRAEGATVERLLATPTPFNSLLWRIVAVMPDGYLEGYRSIFDGNSAIAFTRYEHRPELYESLKDHEPVARIAAFSHGFFAMQQREGKVLISDLRMGQAPYFFFTFAVADVDDVAALQPTPPRPLRWRPPTGDGLAWLGRRIFDPKQPAPELR